MRTLQHALKAILILLTVFVLQTPGFAQALGVAGSYMSGITTLEPLSLEDDSAVLASSPDDETASIKIRAVNPGYNTDDGKNSGELIELINLSGHEVSLDFVAVIYTTKPTSTSLNGKSTVLYHFPVGARFIGQSILLRLAEAPETGPGNQDLVYDTSLAMSGSLALVKTSAEFDPENFDQNQSINNFGKIINNICWTGADGCLPYFSTSVRSRSYTTILLDESTNTYFHTNDYSPLFDPENSGLYLPPVNSTRGDTASNTNGATSSGTSSGSSKNSSSDFDPNAPPACTGLRFSEILSYYTDDAAEQFIELYNSSPESADLSKCKLRYKNKLYPLAASSLFLPSSSYYVYRPAVKLTKNPATENLFEILDANGALVDSLNLPHGQKSGTSYALISVDHDGSPNWQITYSPTPGQPNIYQEFRTCPTGKIINEATGNCVNAPKLSSAAKDCGPGKYRNPATGRCKSLNSDSGEQTPCKEGYERNPETNRCRKIRDNNGADYPVVPLSGTEDNTSFVALWAILGIASLGGGYVIFQYRKEIIYFFRKFTTKIRK